MRRRLAPLIALGFAATLLLGACGREGAGTAPERPAGPPRWSAVRGEVLPAGVQMDIKADAACRVFLIVTGADGRASEGAGRVLAAGELARLSWQADVVPARKGGTSVSVEDAAAGRTEGWIAALDFGWHDGGVSHQVTIVGTRPGKGSARGPRYAQPPALPAVLAFDKPLELCAVAVVDGGTPELALVAGERGARLQGPLDEAGGDRATVLRLSLRVEPAGR